MLTYVCSRCKIEKDASEFSRNTSKKSKRDAYCFVCRREYSQEKYRQNKALRIQQSWESKKKRRIRDTKIVVDYLLAHPCIDCGESNPLVLDFDHINDDKEDSISHLIGSATEIRLKTEMEKCEIRCANCHRLRHAKELNTLAYQYLSSTSGVNG